MSRTKAIEAINKHGVLLVFPHNNRPEPLSLWHVFHPRTKMRWEWDDDGDGRVFKMWQLMKSLSSSHEVVYSKWYQGRATFFSRRLFTALLALRNINRPLSSASMTILDELLADSPLSTRVVKQLTGLQGRLNEPTYAKAMRELFMGFHIVGFGEVDDGAFPSLAVGATSLLHEELFLAAKDLEPDEAQAIVEHHLPSGSPMGKVWRKHQS